MYVSQFNFPNKVNEQTPIIVILHGMGSNACDLLPVAEKIDPSAIQLTIQGTIPYGNGYAYFLPDFRQKSEYEVIHPILESIHHFVKEAIIEKQLEKNPLVFLGFSQGAMLSMGLAFLYPNWMQQSLIFSARMPDFYKEIGKEQGKETVNNTAMFISQGEIDPLFPVEVGRTFVAFAKKNVAKVNYHEYPIGHGIHPQAMMDGKIFYQQTINDSKRGK